MENQTSIRPFHKIDEKTQPPEPGSGLARLVQRTSACSTMVIFFNLCMLLFLAYFGNVPQWPQVTYSEEKVGSEDVAKPLDNHNMVLCIFLLCEFSGHW